MCVSVCAVYVHVCASAWCVRVCVGMCACAYPCVCL